MKDLIEESMEETANGLRIVFKDRVVHVLLQRDPTTPSGIGLLIGQEPEGVAGVPTEIERVVWLVNLWMRGPHAKAVADRVRKELDRD